MSEEAPEKIYADRGPKGGWLYREQRMPDTQHEYIRADLVEQHPEFAAEIREWAGRESIAAMTSNEQLCEKCEGKGWHWFSERSTTKVRCDCAVGAKHGNA